MEAFQALSTLDEKTVAQQFELPSLKTKVIELHSVVSCMPDYKKAQQEAEMVNTDEAWNNFRKVNGALMKQFLVEKYINCPTTNVTDYFTLNENLNQSQVEYAVASSYLIYYIRQIQREKTGKPCPSFPIK